MSLPIQFHVNANERIDGYQVPRIAVKNARIAAAAKKFIGVLKIHKDLFLRDQLKLEAEHVSKDKELAEAIKLGEYYKNLWESTQQGHQSPQPGAIGKLS